MASAPSVLFVNKHYWPDVAATGQQLTDLAEYLAADGFEVHVLTGAGRYVSGALAAPRREVRNGVTVHRVRGTAFGRGTTLGRLADYASFYVSALARVVGGRRFDRVVVLTTPPLLSTLGAVARRLRGRRYGVWSMDLHPDAEEALGMLRPGRPLARALHALNDRGYRDADFVVDLGAYMKARIARKGARPERLHTISVWGSRDEVRPVAPEDNGLRHELGLDGAFVVMYSGNAGLAHRFDEVVEAAHRLRDHPTVRFVFVGDGPRRGEIEAATAGLPHVRYLDYFPRERLDESLSLGDVHLLTLRDDMAGIAVPSKLFGIMAAARPVVMVGPEASEPAEVIRRTGIGAVVSTQPGGGERLAGVLEEMAADPSAASAAGVVAREAFLAEYECEVCCAAWSDLLSDQAGRPAGRARPARPLVPAAL
jgi:colanic acid biosynthesis glycosyl transferase WcaI